MVRFACVQFLHSILQFNLEVEMPSTFLRKKIETHSIKRKQDGLDEIDVFQSFLELTAWVIYRRWMDELGFYVPSTVFQSFRDDGRVNMKGSVQ